MPLVTKKTYRIDILRFKIAEQYNNKEHICQLEGGKKNYCKHRRIECTAETEMAMNYFALLHKRDGGMRLLHFAQFLNALHKREN